MNVTGNSGSSKDNIVKLSQNVGDSNTINSSSSNIKTISNVTKLCLLSCNKTVFLSTAIVHVVGRRGLTLGRVLLDQGSEVSLITRKFRNAASLDIVEGDQSTILVGINNVSLQLHNTLKCVLKSRFSDFSIAI